MKKIALKKWLWRGFWLGVGCGAVYLGWMYGTLPDPGEFKSKNPTTTALIEQRRQEARKKKVTWTIRHQWIPASAIPDLLKKTIRISEDANFYYHEGIDFEELKESIRKNWEKGELARGGSTITQQLAKNLYLSTEKSLFRKAKEYVIARRMEKRLSKERIFYLYLNVIEFGNGIFGVESAARYYFGKPAADLDLEEIIRLTAVIPRPLSIRANGSSRWLMWRSCWIVEKLLLYQYIDETTHAVLKEKFCQNN